MTKRTNLMLVSLLTAFLSCSTVPKEYASYNEYPVREGELTEMEYSPAGTAFALWSPTADEVRVMLYESGNEGAPYRTLPMELGEDGTWHASLKENLKGKFYTFNAKIKGKWLGDTPGIMAKAVGVNGKRAAIMDLNETNPKGWEQDQRPPLKNAADAVIYEMHQADFSADTTSGIRNRGKFLALTETGTHNADGEKTGIDHLKELRITHLLMLPCYDYASIDETKLNENQYSWGYDPQNINVPEGSYSTDPYHPEVRIREFKQMVQALHKAGIRVVLDVVYSHMFNTSGSNFQRTVPGYFYRQKTDGTLADGSACGNETASERPMMRKYMIESILHWVREYHIDGFRFNQMGIHDIETMNQIRAAIDRIDPTILVYGEGWAACQPQLNNDSLAMKANISHMPRIAISGDEIRDGLCGTDEAKNAFLAGLPGKEESIKFGIAGAIRHPQIRYDSVNGYLKPWASQPTQMIAYASCHDKTCLVDRLKAITAPEASPEELIRLDKLAQTVVFTSQGIPFIYAGEEIMRDKKGADHSSNSLDSIHAINWNLKTIHKNTFEYYRGLIALRKKHPAFRMGDASKVRKHLEFLPVEGKNLIAFRLKGHANEDPWEEIIVLLNARKEPAKVTIPAGKYTLVAQNGEIRLSGLGIFTGDEPTVPAQSALILYK